MLDGAEPQNIAKETKPQPSTRKKLQQKIIPHFKLQHAEQLKGLTSTLH